MQEIVVTARKREESLLEIPFAISAFQNEDLQKADLKDFTDLSQFTPGFTFQNATANRADRGTPNIIIRGLNLASPSASSDPALLFIDGAPVFGGEVGSFIDVQRVEVLRGPQTAYFGRNTFSGAVNLVTADPGEELGGFLGVEYGSYDTTDLQGYIEGAIIPERLSFRVSGRVNEKGGQYINNFNGQRDIGEESSQSVVGTLVGKPTDWLKLKVRGNYTEIEDGPAPNFRFGNAYHNCDANGDGDVTWRCGEAPSIDIAKAQVGQQNGFEPGFFGDIAPSVPPYEQTVVRGFSLFSPDSPNSVDGDGPIIDQMGLAKRVYSGIFSAEVDLPGDISLDWISAYSKIMSSIVSDENTLPRNGALAGVIGLSEVFLVERYDENSSHELRFASGNEQRLRWAGGANFIKSESISSCVAGVSSFNPASFTCRPIQEVETLGIFGGLYYDLTQQLTLSGEIRFQNDDISVPAGGFQNDFDDVGGRLTLEYSPRDNLMYFVNYARGFRPGGFNTIFAVLTPEEAASLTANSGASLDVDPETLDQIEFGVKGGWFDQRMQGSAVGYWGEINDQQVTQVTNYTDRNGVEQIITVNNNIGVLGLYGIELEGAFAATEELMLEATFAWNYTEYKEGACVTCVNRGSLATDQDHLGNQTPWVPEFTGSAVATYTRPIKAELDGFARLEFLYESTKYATEANKFETGDRTLVNLRLGVDHEAYRAEFYVTNLFDNETYFNVSNNTDLDDFGNAWVVGLPDRRAIGVRAFLNF
jgi:iron complex outermembrane receptor protein